ncbi:uncharacterized protein [Asterias amurensis]|uniref:uncharacterized protein n=1 Tax=Asterias amurensis TaxID=7602 RepID=UPI003AB5D8B6
MSTAQYSQFQNESDKMYVPSTAPPGYAPQGVPPVGYAPPPPSAQNIAPAPPVNIMMTAPTTQTIISTTHTMPNDHFGFALFVCLCCFWPIGIVALIKANEVRSRFNTGDMLGANQASADARKFSMIGLGIGIASVVISIIITIVYVAVIVGAATSETSKILDGINTNLDLDLGSTSIFG